jgi:hypothetical protein
MSGAAASQPSAANLFRRFSFSVEERYNSFACTITISPFGSQPTPGQHRSSLGVSYA